MRKQDWADTALFLGGIAAALCVALPAVHVWYDVAAANSPHFYRVLLTVSCGFCLLLAGAIAACCAVALCRLACRPVRQETPPCPRPPQS